MKDLNVGFLSVAMWKYNVKIPFTIYNVEDLEVEAFGDRSLKVRVLLREKAEYEDP